MSNHDEIRARLAAATPGPWEADHSEEDNSSVRLPNQDWAYGLAFCGRPADANLIANAPTDLATLLDELTEAERRRVRDVQSILDQRDALAAENEKLRALYEDRKADWKAALSQRDGWAATVARVEALLAESEAHDWTFISEVPLVEGDRLRAALTGGES